MGTAMRGQRPALASLLAWVAMLALLLGTLPLLPQAQAGMAMQMPLEERGGESPLQEEAPAKLRRGASTPVKAAEQAHPPLLLASHWLRTELELVPAAGHARRAPGLAAGRSGHALGRCARAPPAARPGAPAGLIHGLA